MKSNDKITNYVKLFTTGLILIWLFLQSPINPVYSDYIQGEMNLVKLQFFYWVILSIFVLWIVFYVNLSHLFKKLIYFFKELDLDTIIIFLLSFTLFFVLYSYASSVNYYITDNEIHSLIIQSINYDQAVYPPNFLYYLTVNILSGFSKNIVVIYLASSFVLALSIAAKYKISKNIIKSNMPIDLNPFSKKKTGIVLILAASGLILFFPIQDYFGAFKIGIYGTYYTGKITPNVWHNSTIMFLAPFSLLLFYYQYNELKSHAKISKSSLAVLTVLVLLNIFIKPSFFLIFGPVTSVFLFLKHKAGREYFRNMIPIIIGFFILYLMHELIYVLHIGDPFSVKDGSIVFCSPFKAWLLYIPKWYLPIAIVHSLAFPIVYIVFYKGSLKSKLFQYTLALTVFGLLISIFIIEDGQRMPHGNFLWQNVVCYYTLILTITCDLILRYLKEGFFSYKMKILAIIFFLHSLTGVGYIVKLLISKELS